MTATYRDSVSGLASGTSIVVDDTGLSRQAGDVLLLQVWGYDAVTMSDPGTLPWTEISTGVTVASPYATVGHRVFWAIAPSGTPTWPTLGHGANDSIGYVLTAVSDADADDPIDAAALGTKANSVSATIDAPSISPTGVDSLLVCGAGAFPNSAGTGFTPPSGMTEREDIGTWDHYSVATLSLNNSGATGAKTFTSANSSALAGLSSSVAIRSGIQVRRKRVLSDRVYEGAVLVTDTYGEERRVARIENTDGEPGDTIFVGAAEPTPIIEDGDAWLDGSTGEDLAELDFRLDMLETAPELQSADPDEIDLPAPSGGVQYIGAGPALIRRDETDASAYGFVTDALGSFITGDSETKVPTVSLVSDYLTGQSPGYVFLGSDVTVVNNSTTLTNVTDFVIPVGALQYYRFDFWFHVVGSDAADLKLFFDSTSIGSGKFNLTSRANSYTSGAGADQGALVRTMDTEYTNLGLATSGSGTIIEGRGFVSGAFGTGSIQIQAAQAVAHASDIVFKIGSWMGLTPIGSPL